MGGGARETLTGGKGVVEGGEAAAGVQQRRRLHRKAPEKRTPPETKTEPEKRQRVTAPYRTTGEQQIRRIKNRFKYY